MIVASMALVALTSGAAVADPTPREAALFDKLRLRIEAVDRGLDGLLGVSVKDLKTGALIELRPAEVFPPLLRSRRPCSTSSIGGPKTGRSTSPN